MSFNPNYRNDEPERQEIENSQGALVLEFGQDWCGYCQTLSSTLESLLGDQEQIKHIRIADGKGKRLGRSFKVKLWPTLILLMDGKIIAKLVRPPAEQVREEFENLLNLISTSEH